MHRPPNHIPRDHPHSSSYPPPPLASSLVLHLDRQPTERQGDGERQHQQRPDAELESPAEKQGDDKPEEHQDEGETDTRHGNQHRPALVVIEGEPLKPLGQPEKTLHDQQGQNRARRAWDKTIGVGGWGRSCQ